MTESPRLYRLIDACPNCGSDLGIWPSEPLVMLAGTMDPQEPSSEYQCVQCGQWCTILFGWIQRAVPYLRVDK